jgi:meiotic recombination protein DMC1
MTSADLAQLRKRCFRISTRSRQWDSILNEGFQSASINEVYGEFRKSHLLPMRFPTDGR